MLVRSAFIILCLNLFIAFNLLSQHTTEIMRGMTVDSRSGMRIADVQIYPDFKGDTIQSDFHGRFKMQISSEYRDNIHFGHPGYYPYLQRIKDRSKRYFQRIELINKSLEFDTIFYPSFEENRIIYGRVVDKQTMLPLNNAVINLEDNKRIGYTDSKGFYKLCLPEITNTLIVSYPDYYSSNVNVPEIIHRGLKDVFIEPMRQSAGLDFWKENKNSIRLIVNELVSGAIAIDYERFLKLRHSVGLKSSFYLFKGIPILNPINVNNDMQGIKLSPYYRNYFRRNQSRGLFVETKISWGYFDFKEINYQMADDDDVHEYFSEISKSFGCGVSMGWMLKIGQGPLTMDLSVGLQYFPLNVPKIQQGTHSFNLEVDNTFWYVGGAGSVVEVKFMIGGIF